MVLSVIALIQGQIIWFPYSIQCAPLLALVIYIGNLFKRSDILNKLTRNKYIVILVIYSIGLILGYSNIGYVIAYMKDYILCLIVGLCGSICIIKIAHNNIFDKLGEYIGRDTLYILCIHLFTMNCLNNTLHKILDKFIGIDFINKSLFVGINVLFPIIMMYVCKYIVSKLDKYKLSIKSNKIDKVSILICVFISIILSVLCSTLNGYFNTIYKLLVGSLIIGLVVLIGLYKKEYLVKKVLNNITSLHLLYFLYALLLVWGICGNEVRIFNPDAYSLSRYLSSTLSLFILMYMFVRFILK